MIALADCAVTVADAKEAGRWWKEKVGFEVDTVGPGDHAIMVAPPGERFVVHLCAGFAPVEPGNTGIAFVTDEIESLVSRMTANGVAFPEPFQKSAWGGSAKFADPDGNVFWLIGAPTGFIEQQLARRAPGPPRRPPRRRSAAPKRARHVPRHKK
jgi:catechol 2,3-dioxygenase-like lactoylglutathione lyase family enzyme